MRPVGAAEVFVRLTQASTNYVALGGRGFEALTRLVATCPGRAIDYPDTETALALVEELAARHDGRAPPRPRAARPMRQCGSAAETGPA